CRPRSASNSSTSRYDKEKRRYQATARRMTSGSNCLHLNRPETDDARSIGPAYQITPAKLQHCHFVDEEIKKGASFQQEHINLAGDYVRPASKRLQKAKSESEISAAAIL